MSITLSLPSSLPHVHVSTSPHSMSILSRVPFRHLKPFPDHHLRRRRLASLAAVASVRQDTTVWTPAPLSQISPAAESLFHISIDVSDAPDLAASHTRPGQYLQLRIADLAKPTFLAIASPPAFASASGAFEFLVKSVAGSTAEVLCGLNKGDVVEISQVMGGGFDVDRIQPPDAYPTVVIFATGSGISPIRSLIESGFSANQRSDVRLYYGARNLKRMAYQVCSLYSQKFEFLHLQFKKISCLFLLGLRLCFFLYRIGLKNGNLPVLRLCRCYRNLTVVGLVKLATYRCVCVYAFMLFLHPTTNNYQLLFSS
ncbi:hypothetical protein Ddye_030116 [Dipteronia dyeriana]|uniref:FAD-binding FR-type domain-containing protein n=1 Tax=Dipteronia dyeriana TaxID=168575 RepID=A0AAD9WL71_9ROSI|nr:hypothetical protein Ddye_030116 [Dipteronia dyeriana]